MKKILFGLLIGVTVISVASYLYFNADTSAHECLVPNNATGVAILNPAEAVKDAKVKFPLTDLSHKEDVKTSINFISPIYAFVTETGYLGFAAMLTDGDDLEKNLDDVRSSNGFTWGLIEGFLVCHDGDRALFMGPSLSWNDKNAQREMEELMRQESSSSVLLQELDDEDAPLAAKISMKALPEQFRKQYNEMLEEYSVADMSLDMESLIFNFNANVTENSLTMTAYLSSFDKETTAILEEYQEKLSTVSHHLDVHIPQNYSMWLTTSVDGTAICNLLNENPYTSSQMNMLNGFVNVSEILNVFHGDLLLVAGDADGKEVAMVAEVSNTDIVNSPLKKILNLFDIDMGIYAENPSSPIYVTTSKRMKEEMRSTDYKIDKEDQYDESCTFFMTINPQKALQSAHEYTRESKEVKSAMDFLRQDVRKINLRVTRDNIECKMILSSTFNDCIRKWNK